MTSYPERAARRPSGRRKSDPTAAHPALVEAIVSLPSDPNRRRIRVDGKFVASIYAHQVDSLGVRVGDEWNAKLAAAIEAAAAEGRVRQEALKALGRAAMSSHRLTERLLKKGHDSALVRRVVAALQEEGWVNDRAFAEAAAAAVARRGPAGRSLVQQRLTARGLPDSLAAEVAGAALRDVNPVESAVEYGRQRLRKMDSKLNRSAQIRRLCAALARRGFDEETVAAAMDRLGLLKE